MLMYCNELITGRFNPCRFFFWHKRWDNLFVRRTKFIVFPNTADTNAVWFWSYTASDLALIAFGLAESVFICWEFLRT
jgi:hypothetical protein